MRNEVNRPQVRPTRWLLVAAVSLAIVLVFVALLLTQPLPPSTVVLATGPEGEAYETLGQRYREFFAEHGVNLELRNSNGAVDNIALLNDPGSGVSVALVESGTTDPDASPGLASLGTLFYEPFWLFSHVVPIDETKAIRKDMRVAIGRPGSFTYKFGREVGEHVGLELDRIGLRELGHIDSGEALLQGDIDIVGISLPFESAIVQRLLRDPAIIPISWPRADAHIALRPFLHKRTLPRGVADLARDLPDHDLVLVATKTSLIVRDDLHPALQHLLLEAAAEIHSGPGVFHRASEFPAAEPFDLPLSDIARDYYRSGKPFLQRYLPFWLAAYASRLLVLLIPIIGIAYPLFRVLPAVYSWSMRRRILRLYGELKFLEAELDMNTPPAVADALKRLNRLEQRASRMRVPITFSQMLYTLKQHISLVRARIPTARSE